jgi:hypothetical protein
VSGPGDRVLHLGKYCGLTIDRVAETDEGLLYLDWLADQHWLKDPLRSDLRAYLDADLIKGELDRVLDRRRS